MRGGLRRGGGLIQLTERDGVLRRGVCGAGIGLYGISGGDRRGLVSCVRRQVRIVTLRGFNDALLLLGRKRRHEVGELLRRHGAEVGDDGELVD